MELRVRAMRIGLRLRKLVSAGAVDTTTGAVVIATGSGAGIGPLSAFYKKSNEFIEKMADILFLRKNSGTPKRFRQKI
jgi:hypothetical protein